MAETTVYQEEEPHYPRVEIPFSKPKIGALIAYNLVIVGVGLALYLTAGRLNLLIEWFFKITAIAGVVFFGNSIVLFTGKLFQKKPGFTIDQAGFIDNADALNAGRIYWEEISEIAQWQFMGQEMILVKVTDPLKVLKSQNFFKRLLMRLNWKRFETPVSITSGALQIDQQKLFQLIQQNLEKHE